MAKGDSPEKKQGTFRRLIEAYRITKRTDKHIGLICLAWALAAGLAVGAVFWFLIHPLAGLVTAVATMPLAFLIVFGRRAERSAYAQLEGQPGAAAAALGVLKRGWNVQNAVAVTKNQDLVHRVVGRPGIVLVGEGNETRVRHLLGVEKKKHARVVGEIPIYDIVVGDSGDEGVVPIRKLSKHVSKLPRNIKPAEVTDVLQRLKALDAARPQLPMPKGPMPTNLRQARAAMRGGRGSGSR
ncbi:MAG TPA: DUF4191 domain-containing protein [Nocardioidaceae bacterium]|nr:DUF4191 domain-containing protein [Nocardioidaceae bacterium]